MAINKAFLGHSMYAEMGVEEALERYAYYGATLGTGQPPDAIRVKRFVQALRDMQVGTLWLELFNRSGEFDSTDPTYTARKLLFAELASANINWVGWGYCAGSQCARNKLWIKQLKNDLNLTAFVLDVEPGNQLGTDANGNPIYDVWNSADFTDFVSDVNELFGTENLAITTWPILSKWEQTFQALTMMKSVAAQVAVFNPQVYWSSQPPVAYVQQSMQSWRDAGFTNPLVVTGRTYWEQGITQQQMEASVSTFVSDFGDWSKMVGYGWYHAGMPTDGLDGAMSDNMITTIINGHLGGRPYMKPPSGV